MRRKSKKWLSVLVAAAMAVSSLGLSVCAAPADEAVVRAGAAAVVEATEDR